MQQNKRKKELGILPGFFCAIVSENILNIYEKYFVSINKISKKADKIWCKNVVKNANVCLDF